MKNSIPPRTSSPFCFISRQLPLLLRHLVSARVRASQHRAVQHGKLSVRLVAILILLLISFVSYLPAQQIKNDEVDRGGDNTVAQGICVPDDLDIKAASGKVVAELREGEQPLTRASLTLKRVNDDGPVVARRRVNAKGEFSFPGLKPGTYLLRVAQPGLTDFYVELHVTRSSVAKSREEIIIVMDADFEKPCRGSRAMLRRKSVELSSARRPSVPVANEVSLRARPGKPKSQSFLKRVARFGENAGGATTPDEAKQPKTLRSQRVPMIASMLAALHDVKDDREALAALFKIGDGRIGDLIEALHDPHQEISLRAQVVIRYLGNETGMKALEEWYSTQAEFSIGGPTPLPLRERDYEFIRDQYLNKPSLSWSGAEQYIYALALDDSPRAKALLLELKKATDPTDDFTVGARAMRLTTSANAEKVLTGQSDVAKLVLDNAFFIRAKDRPFTSARLLGFSGANDKALVELYINRGRLAEEWYHVVLSKEGQGWKFFSITQVAVS